MNELRKTAKRVSSPTVREGLADGACFDAVGRLLREALSYGRATDTLRGLLIVALLSFICLPVLAQSASDHEYSFLREKEFAFNDFTYKTLEDAPLNLREAAKGKKFVLIHFFAAWCHNSNYDVKTVQALHEQFKDQGLAVIGIGEYSKPDELREFIAKHHPTYPIVLETQKTKDRTKSSHYAYRTAANDQRLWGTPFNVMLAVEDFSASGATVTTKALVTFGELQKAEVTEWLTEKLKIDKR